jgi:hypothetical protein
MNKEYIVFSMQLAGYLMLNKFPLKRMGKSNKPGSSLNIFYFNQSEDLLKKVEEYKLLK